MHLITFRRVIRWQVYDNTPTPSSRVAQYLNEAVPSGHMYLGDDPEQRSVYGDGRTQWNHLQLKIVCYLFMFLIIFSSCFIKEGDYATLPALALQVQQLGGRK